MTSTTVNAFNADIYTTVPHRALPPHHTLPAAVAPLIYPTAFWNTLR